MTAHPIRTVASLARSNRRLDLRHRAADVALEDMRRGASLNLTYGQGREWWTLSNGQFVAAGVAAILIARPDIEVVSDTLIPNARAQTWHFIEPKEELR